MRTMLLTLTIGLAAPLGPAFAEDFTGFYAGVNAGYAHKRDKDTSVGTPGPVPGSASSDDSKGLPPSALSASQALQAGRSTAAGQPASRR